MPVTCPRCRCVADDPDDPYDVNLDRNRAMCVGVALIRSRGQQNRAAQLLGVSACALGRLLTVHDLRPLLEIGVAATNNEDEARARLVGFVRARLRTAKASSVAQSEHRGQQQMPGAIARTLLGGRIVGSR